MWLCYDSPFQHHLEPSQPLQVEKNLHLPTNLGKPFKEPLLATFTLNQMRPNASCWYLGNLDTLPRFLQRCVVTNSWTCSIMGIATYCGITLKHTEAATVQIFLHFGIVVSTRHWPRDLFDVSGSLILALQLMKLTTWWSIMIHRFP
jgi:hypothetical protein